ncbi:hypothetical protein LP316_05290 [Thalassotalea sp. LPB0316]|uniref:hypothetical protein n=1 Tax=Thalassotalea sp. LPB0316 TaxID=2769490 RepID=UPI0018664B7C|nr:hypothetical protein [Thalassotalea sp. LPB0316]QOL26715.1 hypothetical protein LP316_05290 [Thalassotalea sp. LPB0316]
MRVMFKSLFVLVAVILVSGCAQTTVRHHQDFESVARNVQSVVLLPAQVEIEQINFDGDNTPLEEKSALIRSQIEAIAEFKLASESLEVVEFDFAQAIEQDEEFAYAITQAKEAWETAKGELYEQGLVSEKEKANFQASLGSALNIIADKTGADSALLIQYSGFEKSSGMIAKDVASSVLVGVLTLGAVVPIQATEGAFIDVALVDTNSGKVIWANRKGGTTADATPAEIVFGELPDLTWKSELTNKPVESTVVETVSPKVPDVQ